ncbi:hypothetical protein P691DRAFT_812211 [Macrolepiota fuliginosa MF-IS2]|uniref:Uncharacterized protein n=1 Tax=Macrolepiota fuliginosa MF-IS2 TaxID=1400762 RepID=A0A9P5XFS3_9AGAR|nr:hypothetical protein P691DRAFT_812211 [Macrolepiota fuliginosa MF-IS2]
MTKPTLLQALLNRPSQSYAFPQEKQSLSDGQQAVARISTDPQGQSMATPGASSASIDKAYNSSRQRKQTSSIDTSSRPSMDFQGPKTHVSSSSHASQSSSVVSTATSYISTRLPPSPPPPPTKDHISELVPKPNNSRNNISSNPDSAPQQPTGAAVNTRRLNPGGLVQNYSYEEDEDVDDESAQDIFYTPNSSPRASFASSISIPMSYATAATTTTPRKTSRRSLRGGTLTQEHSLPYSVINEAPEDDKNLGRTQRQTDALPSLSKKNTKASPSNNPTSKGPSVGITSTEPTPSRTPAPTLPSPPSTRIAVPSTRTPSRSNSLNRGRPTADPRSGLTHGSTGSIGRVQGQSTTSQGRAKATVSVASSGSSMSSNSLDGHSLVFSDLTSEATRATTLSPDGNDSGNALKKEYGSAGADATKRWVDKTASDAAKATTTPMTSNTALTTPPQKRRPNKSHTYNGLGVGSTSVSTGTSLSTPALTNPNHYQQYQYQSRNRDNKAPSVMMSMTAVLEAAEEDELYRNGSKKGDVGSPAWKTRQLLKQHMSGSGKNSVVNTGPNAGAGPPAGVNAASKGKGKERAGIDNYVGSGGGSNGRAEARASSLEKGKGRERDYYPTPYTRHQPITSSPLAPPKPLPALGHPPTRNNSFLQVPLLSRPKLAHRRSRSLGAESMPMYQRSDSPTPSRLPGTSSSHQQDSDLPRSHKHTRAHSISRSHGASSSTSANTETVDLTAVPHSSGELPSKGTAGYTSLVLPRAPPPLNLDSSTSRNGYGYGKSLIGGGSGKVDLTKDGLAQTTMASVEVVRGLGGIVGRTGLKGMFNFPLVRRKTIPVKFGLGAGTSEDGGHGVDGGPGGAGGTTVLGFTSYRRPPEYVSSGGVLVQVWAVGVDGIDGKLVGVRMAHGGGGGDNVNGIPPSPASTGSTDPDPEAAGGLPKRDGNGARPAGADQRVADRMQDLEEEIDKPKMKGMGLGRSLSLRERLSRSVSLGRSAGKEQRERQRSPDKPSQAATLKTSSGPQSLEKQNKNAASGNATRTVPGVGYVPGRSFVGRVVECGWEVRDEIVRKGDWVVGLLDIKRCGALTEFIVVDRHRIHRIPHPRMPDPVTGILPPTFSPPLSVASSSTPTQHSLTLEELALIPLCGIPAYRAVRTFMYAFTSTRDNPSLSSVGGTSDMAKHRHVGTDATSNFAAYNTMISRLNLGDHENGRRRRALVLKGHDGIGAIAVQMLVLRGWRVCVHVPFIASPPNVPTTSAIAEGFMEEVEERIRKWGAEEVIFDDGEVVGSDEGRGAVVRVIDGLREDGDVFDAVLDTVGGKDVRAAAEKLLRSPGRRVDPDESGNGGGRNGKGPAKGLGQFTTVVGDSPERAIPSAGDLFRAGLRSLKFGGGGGGGSTILSTERGSSENVSVRSHEEKGGKVGYAWVNISQDVDWEGKGVGETIGSIMELALEYGIKPWVGTEYAIINGTGPTNSRPGTPSLATTPTPTAAGGGATNSRLDPGHWEGKRIFPFEKAPDIFVSGGALTSGGTVVVKIAT